MDAHRLESLLRYAWRAQTIYDVHAPRAYAFAREVVEDTRHLYAYDRIEAMRRRYLNDETRVSFTDFGAAPPRATTRSVREVAAASASAPRFARYLYRLGEWLDPRTVVELGTNLGIGTAALAAAVAPAATVYTLEGGAALQQLARREVARVAERACVEFVAGPFAESLPGVLAAAAPVDLAFVDGHHDGAATYDYFEQLLAAASEHGVLVFDDIYWSPAMTAAWARIRAHPQVRLTFDLFQWGVVVLDPGVTSQQHIVLAPWRYKPWHMGFLDRRSR